jgi:proteic killer suppression protein
LDISFKTKSLRSLCEVERVAQSKLGKRVAERLKSRLADLDAASCVKELVAGRPREIPKGRVAVELCDGFLLVFCANHDDVPLGEGGVVDWLRVNRVKVLSVGPGIVSK